MNEFSMTIDGRRAEATEYFNVLNPATGKVAGQCPEAGSGHLEKAVAAAKQAFLPWRQASEKTRAELLMAMAKIIEDNSEELMTLLTMETGKPLNGYQGIGSGLEVGGSAAWTRATAELTLPIELLQDNDEARIELHRKPLGVVGSITPWNWPLMIAIWHIMPALMSGNTVVLKPSSLTPLTSLKFVELANTLLPPGVLNCITAKSGIGSKMALHRDIRKIVFTGSTPTGKRIMENGARNLKRLTLELGGNDAGIILPDIEIEKAAPAIFAAAFNNNGQTCAALKRLYVHEDIYDSVCDALVSIAKTIVVGNGLEPDVDLGPLQNKEQLDYVIELAEDAKEFGAKCIFGGEPIDGPGFFYPPTLVTNISDGARLVDEEQFGPILPIVKYSDINDAIARANNSCFGLGGSVWSGDVEMAKELAMKLESGTAWVNTHSTIQPNAPFGGVKESGFGVEFTREGLNEFTAIQTVKVMKT
jgi:acyl-CoA reductase-like NAD-dependent aldehyde dehydrogenase